MATRKFITDENLKYFAGLVKKADSALSTEITNAKNAASNAATAASGALTEAQKKIAKGSLATINGQSLESGGNIELDFTVAEVVTTLPDITAAVKTKIYLVPSSSTETNNSYTEYIKVTVSGTDKWEKVGEYKAGIDTSVFAKAADLTSHTGNKSNPHGVTAAQVGLGNVNNTSDADKPISTATQAALDKKANQTTVDFCVKSITVTQSGDTVSIQPNLVNSAALAPDPQIISKATTSKGGLMSAADKTKLDGIAANANNYSLPLAASGTRGGIQVGYTTSGKNYAVQLSNEKAYVNVPWIDTVATQSANGLLSAADKKTIDGIASTYVAESSLVSLSDTDIQTLWDNA